MYGWRARIGLIIAHSNTTMEPEFHRLAPPGVSVHAARVTIGARSREGLKVASDNLDEAAASLSELNARAVGYACTAVNILAGADQDLAQARRISAITHCPAIPTSIAIAEALVALNIRRISVATVCPEDVNEAIASYWTALGFEVVRIGGLDLGGNRQPAEPFSSAPISHQGLQSAPVVYNMARRVFDPQAEAVIISGANLTSMDIVDPFERDFGVPVISSGLATVWACLQAAGIHAPVAGAGRLLAQAPALGWARLPRP